MSESKTVWDSGKVEASHMYADCPIKLSSREIIEWRVMLWDEDGRAGEWSDKAYFEMGLLSSSDRKAVWITGGYHPKKNAVYPVDYFSKSFSADKILKARLYISACGLYAAEINGERVGEFIFAPGSTDYRKRIQYQTYDATGMIKAENVLTVKLADGWYRGSNGAKGRRNIYEKQTKLILQLEMTDVNGETRTVVSDGSFSWSNDGEIRFADLKDGEAVDANMLPSFGGKAAETSFSANLTASDNVIVRKMERFSPTELITTPSGKTVLKFPQNISGYVSFRLSAHKGDRIHLTLGEMLDGEGELTLRNIQCVHKGKRTPLQELDYTCDEGINEYTPEFFYGGFQYARIETTIPFEKEAFTAVAVYSAVEETAAFECSNSLINAFYKSTLRSLKSNSTDFPSDCPTRERMGWTGDSQVFFNTASYMTDYAAFARKHIRDIYDRQWKSGRLPQIAPFANEDWFMWTMNGSVGWACAGVYIPYYYYRKYGDERILKDNYEGMLKYADFMIKRAGKWGGIYANPMRLSRKNRKYAVNAGQSYGEWAEPNDVCAFQPYDKELEKKREYSDGAKRAYQELVTKKKFTLDTYRQAKLARPLYMGLLTKEQEEYARKRLIKALDNYGWRLGTGFLSTPFILDVLSETDVEYAYRLLENEKLPGWLFMPKSGATTIWEAWEGNSTCDKGIASLNHYSKGAVCKWLFSNMCGIRVESENHFIIAPQPGGDLTYAKAAYRSVYGTVESSWKRENAQIVFSIIIPPNTTAEILLPDRTSRTVPTGKYTFT